MSFVCANCKRGRHDQCPEGTWCDCGYRDEVVIKKKVSDEPVSG
jgi:DNA-directed RNA polymerase subunit RPC12/RpoP